MLQRRYAEEREFNAKLKDDLDDAKTSLAEETRAARSGVCLCRVFVSVCVVVHVYVCVRLRRNISPIVVAS